jgi:hypothetical protein
MTSYPGRRTPRWIAVESEGARVPAPADRLRKLDSSLVDFVVLPSNRHDARVAMMSVVASLSLATDLPTALLDLPRSFRWNIEAARSSHPGVRQWESTRLDQESELPVNTHPVVHA